MTPRTGTAVDLAALSKLAPELAETFVTLASDIALVLDAGGVIHNVATGRSGPLAPAADSWIGRPWADTVTGEARGKIEELLREVDSTGSSHRREINHPTPGGADIPVAYTALRLGVDGPVLAVGRDLRAIAGIQQQFVEAQKEVEREYWKHRQAETRYRVLFQVATDGVLVVDSESLRIIDANQAAGGLFDIPAERLIGMEVLSTLDRASRTTAGELMNTARGTGLPGEIRAWLVGRRITARLSATPFRSGTTMQLLVRVRADEPGDAGDSRLTLVRLVECTPDAVVVTDIGGRIQMANPAFIELAQFADEGHARGRKLGDLVADGLGEVIRAARENGIAAGRTLVLRGLLGQVARVEVSAALLAEEDQESIGLTMRVREAAPRAPATERRRPATLAAAIDTITARLGTLGMEALMGQVAELARRHFANVALAATDGDALAAARLLGISPQELAVLGGTPAPGRDSSPDPKTKN